MTIRLEVREVVWPIAGSFTISRGSRTEARTVQVRLTEAAAGRTAVGQAEAVPYAHYGETVPGTIAEIEGLAGAVAEGLTPDGLRERLPPGAARNALDCALWDLAAKREGRPVHALLGRPAPGPVTTAFTLSVGAPEAMAAKAAEAVAANRPLLKVKLAGDGDLERLGAIRAAAPSARLIADANEAWTLDRLKDWAPKLAALKIEMIEQPLPAGSDDGLADWKSPVPLCADESCHGLADLDRAAALYDVINIKLDKTGGLTEALLLKDAAEARGLTVMVGCMLGSSLAMAPAMLPAQGAQVVDLDGPLLLARDMDPPLAFDGATVSPPPPALWG